MKVSPDIKKGRKPLEIKVLSALFYEGILKICQLHL